MGGGLPTHALRFGLHSTVMDHGDPRPEGVAHATRALLHDVGQLMSEDLLPAMGVRVVLAGSEEKVRAMSESQGTNGSGFLPHVDAHIAELCAEERFHLLQYGIGQRSPRSTTELGQVLRQLEGLTIG